MSNEAAASWTVGDDIDWDAPWSEVYVRTELPFWMMVGPTDLSVEISQHSFPVTVSDHFFEYSYGHFSDSKHTVFFRGSRKTADELSPLVDYIRSQQPGVQITERKCKTIVRIATRCNSDIASKAHQSPYSLPSSTRLYLEDLCRGHLPVVNRVIEAYRLETYDYFAQEVSSWDVPFWHIDFKDGCEVTVTLHPYRGWDHKPVIKPLNSPTFVKYSLTEPDQLRRSLSKGPAAGELELLDSLSLFEKGDYSGAVRRAVTALEVIAEASLRLLLTDASGAAKAAAYLHATETSFEKRVGKICGLSKRNFPFWRRLREVRVLRHQIVHDGYRVKPAEKGLGQMHIDCCRWMYNWFENDQERRAVREHRIGLRSLGRDQRAGIFNPTITPEGIRLSPIFIPEVHAP